jgi:type IV pilus assembly protein PilW
MRTRRFIASIRPRVSSGFTLIELMVAITISIFLIGGMMILLQNVRSTYTMQTSLATLEDNERLAMTLITEVVQSAGYFPQPMLNSAASTMPASNNFPNDAGSPSMLGGANAQGDTIVVRFAADSTAPDLMNCMGQTDSGAAIDWENTFYVDPSGNLTCQVTDGLTNTASTPVVIASGLTTNTNTTTNPPGMTILYGVPTGTSTAPTCMDTYKTAAQMSATDWGNVCAVKVTLTFADPVPSGPATVSLTRVIAVMNKV